MHTPLSSKKNQQALQPPDDNPEQQLSWWHQQLKISPPRHLLLFVAVLVLCFQQSNSIRQTQIEPLQRWASPVQQQQQQQQKKYAIATYIDGPSHMYGLYSIARQAQTTGMVSEVVKVVVGVSKSLFEGKEKTKNNVMDVKRVLAQWKEEGFIHEIYPFDNNVIRKILWNKAGGLWIGVFNKLLL